jgi:hypothetical protein
MLGEMGMAFRLPEAEAELDEAEATSRPTCLRTVTGPHTRRTGDATLPQRVGARQDG